MSIDARALDSARRMHPLRKSAQLRQRAIADFVLSTAQAAADLRRMLEFDGRAAYDTRSYLESLILERLRELTGVDLLATIQSEQEAT